MCSLPVPFVPPGWYTLKSSRRSHGTDSGAAPFVTASGEPHKDEYPSLSAVIDADDGTQLSELIQEGVNIFQYRYPDGEDTFYRIVRHGRLQCLKALTTHIEDHDNSLHAYKPRLKGSKLMNLACQNPKWNAVPMVNYLKSKYDLDMSQCGRPRSFCPLHVAAASDNVDLIQHLISAYKVNVNERDGMSPKSALHLATEYGNLAAMRALSKAGIDTELSDERYEQAIHIAVKHDDTDAIILLLDIMGADIEASHHGTRTPLWLSVKYDLACSMDVLLDRGADVKRISYGEHLLHYAVRYAAKKCLESLLIRECVDVEQVDKKGNHALHVAASTDDIETINLLRRYGASVDSLNRESKSALHVAAEGGHKSALHILLIFGANPSLKTLVNANGTGLMLPIHFAAYQGSLECVKTLLHKCPECVNMPNANGQTALSLAKDRGHESIVQLLASKGARFEISQTIRYLGTADKPKVMFETIMNNYHAMITILWENGYDLQESLDPLFDGSPLMLAAGFNGDPMIPTARDDGNPTVLVAGEKDRCLCILIECGVDLEQVDSFGDTALHHACRHANAIAVQMLIKAGANIEAENQSTLRPLHIACEVGSPDCLEALRDAGVRIDANVLDSGTRMTSLQFARLKGTPEIVKMLESVLELPRTGRKPRPVSKHLCFWCREIKIDDKALGGQMTIDEEGRSILNFPGNALFAKKRPEVNPNIDYCRRDRLPDLPNLHKSAGDGCEFCQELLNAITNVRIPKGVVEIRMRFWWQGCNDKQDSDILRPVALVVNLTNSNGEFARLDIDEDGQPRDYIPILFLTEPGEDTTTQWLRIPPGPRSEVMHVDTIQKVRDAIKHCEEFCKPVRNNDFLPTRLLDLGPQHGELREHDSERDTIRLIETKSMQSKMQPPYAALSYCWGNREEALRQLKTEKVNLSERLSGIPYAALTQVMKDTVTACRFLSIRYVWIDALCIIQGDLADWQRESAMMGDVYSNAYITICAIASSSCHEGFLSRPRSVAIPFQSTVSDEPVAGSFRLRYHALAYPPRSASALVDIVESGHQHLDRACQNWETRAWTHQERHLSHRLLSFGKTRTYYQCPHMYLAEPFEGPTGKLSSGGPQDPYFCFDTVKWFSKQEKPTYRDIRQEWLRWVSDYSTRKSTVREDKLPALAGIASLVAQQVGSGEKYVAGCWSGNIVRSLLWESMPSVCTPLARYIQSMIRPSQYVSPSWSWASQVSAVNFLKFESGRGADHQNPGRTKWFVFGAEKDFQEECEILEAWSSAFLNTDDLFGRITSARLTIKGKCIPIINEVKFVCDENFGGQDEGNTWKTRLNNDLKITCHLDWAVNEDSSELAEQGAIALLISSTVREDCLRRRAPPSDVVDNDYLDRPLPVQTLDLEHATRFRHARGLILCPAGESETFVRIGIFFSHGLYQGGLTAFSKLDERLIHLV